MSSSLSRIPLECWKDDILPFLDTLAFLSVIQTTVVFNRSLPLSTRHSWIFNTFDEWSTFSAYILLEKRRMKFECVRFTFVPDHDVLLNMIQQWTRVQSFISVRVLILSIRFEKMILVSLIPLVRSIQELYLTFLPSSHHTRSPIGFLNVMLNVMSEHFHGTCVQLSIFDRIVQHDAFLPLQLDSYTYPSTIRLWFHNCLVSNDCQHRLNRVLSSPVVVTF